MAAETQQATAPAGRRSQVRLSRRESRQRIVAAAAELVRTRSYAELSVDAVMREAGLGRTIF
jgi:AcrR family transcriptional regulator